ncbi:MBL fold metallo-hydrolase [Candidatus Palauibacter sp.]|uniref:MBL fold metallo-hydrolase n=1 Tax=Candidatus Palauibacter sp. TaxID=3101350 RepID=UPI003B016D8C
MRVHPLDARTSIVDLRFQGFDLAIGTGVLETGDGLALVDPGPTTCLGALKAGLAEAGFDLTDVRAILLSHIHLDHATASGTIVREVPEASVYVHPIGAIHMIRPERLLASAGRIYGDLMETLWGEFLPVPAESVTEVDEGDTVRLGDRTLRVAYTPGHAKHHVAYFEEDTGTAWVGDDAGIRIPPGGVIPVTPPPDVDVEAWNTTIDRILEWRPDRIIPTHFGPVDDPAAHFAELREELAKWAGRVRASLAGEDPANPDTAGDAPRANEFAAWVEEDLRARMPAEPVDTYINAFGARDSWWGLARYWRKRGG